MQKMNLAILDTAMRAVEKEHGTNAKYLLEQTVMREAWSVVAPKGDWRGPVNAVIDPETCIYDADILREAIRFMTACDTVTEGGDDGTNPNRSYTLVAKGYRAGPAGP